VIGCYSIGGIMKGNINMYGGIKYEWWAFIKIISLSLYNEIILIM
jgi:hypothetical protein